MRHALKAHLRRSRRKNGFHRGGCQSRTGVSDTDGIAESGRVGCVLWWAVARQCVRSPPPRVRGVARVQLELAGLLHYLSRGIGGDKLYSRTIWAPGTNPVSASHNARTPMQTSDFSQELIVKLQVPGVRQFLYGVARCDNLDEKGVFGILPLELAGIEIL